MFSGLSIIYTAGLDFSNFSLSKKNLHSLFSDKLHNIDKLHMQRQVRAGKADPSEAIFLSVLPLSFIISSF